MERERTRTGTERQNAFCFDKNRTRSSEWNRHRTGFLFFVLLLFSFWNTLEQRTNLLYFGTLSEQRQNRLEQNRNRTGTESEHIGTESEQIETESEQNGNRLEHYNIKLRGNSFSHIFFSHIHSHIHA